jgi:hypothetical protein
MLSITRSPEPDRAEAPHAPLERGVMLCQCRDEPRLRPSLHFTETLTEFFELRLQREGGPFFAQ